MSKRKKTIIMPAPGKQKGKEEQHTSFALLIDVRKKDEAPFKIKGLIVQENNGGKNFKPVALNNSNSLYQLSAMPHMLGWILHSLTQDKLGEEKKFLERDADVKNICGANKEKFVQQGLLKTQHDTFQRLKPLSSLIKWYYQFTDEQLITTSSIKPAAISSYLPKLSFELVRNNNGILRLIAWININDQSFPFSEFRQHGFLLQSKNEFFLLDLKDAETLESFSCGFIDARNNNAQLFMQQTVIPLSENYEVKKDTLLKKEIVATRPQGKVYLNELNNRFLMITAKWQYGDIEIEEDSRHADIIKIETEEAIYEIQRDVTAENETKSFLRSMHNRFLQQNNNYFYLSFGEAEKNQWFVKFYRKLVDNNIPVYGMEHLKHFRYNINVPQFKIEHDGNGIDWFDLRIRISWGTQEVSLSDLQKALFNRQSFILLKDGTIGAIPEEWTNKYSLLLKLGDVEKDKLRLSKIHWTLTQDLSENEDLAQRIIPEDYKTKWQRLQDRDTSLYKIPKSINAELRDYQKAGFEWMCLLDEMQWGGCLADDMGLGKTLQTITFIQYLVEKNKKEIHLVVCPTSLLYNWENELKKFAPKLIYHIHYGQQRVIDVKEWKKKNIIITSYGCVRSDIEQLQSIKFGYIICDESHVIKNPSSQTAKAIMQLQSGNRLILSGTPIQNNTLDLYSQMQFINPGLLGNKEFFKTEFATPIDKFGNKEKSAQLRKLIYPFMLRRKKEQVAKDLPAKTEITLWCEMGEEQRKVYNDLKNYYRENLLQKIEKEGVGANAIYILEGLTRLRQACNAPQLIKNGNLSTKESVKIEELLNEIEDNIGGHKVLVFSQFTRMLQLIAEEMQQRNIAYLYLDGSTKAEDRSKFVEQFQSTDDEKIFLISLKAGGVGLNLTAADYVYLVDPWWNPAAEQQAIDRTHRISQQNKVFAYKMICRDTVEEKILALQQRKKTLAEDLISEDAGFIKKLSTEDVEYLFS